MKLILKNNGSSYQQRNYFSKNPVKNFLHRYPLKKAAALVPNRQFDKIIDIGCGDGVLLPTLSAVCRELHGIDIRDQYFPPIKNYRLKNLILKKDDIQNSSLKDNYFDLIVSLETLEHLPNPDKAISEIRRILKKGSIGIISVPVEIGFPLLIKQVARTVLVRGRYRPKYTLKEFLPRLLKKPIKTIQRAPPWHKNFDYRIIKRLLIKNNLKILKTKYLPIGPNSSYRILIKFQK